MQGKDIVSKITFVDKLNKNERIKVNVSAGCKDNFLFYVSYPPRESGTQRNKSHALKLNLPVYEYTKPSYICVKFVKLAIFFTKTTNERRQLWK